MKKSLNTLISYGNKQNLLLKSNFALRESFTFLPISKLLDFQWKASNLGILRLKKGNCVLRGTDFNQFTYKNYILKQIYIKLLIKFLLLSIIYKIFIVNLLNKNINLISINNKFIGKENPTGWGK